MNTLQLGGWGDMGGALGNPLRQGVCVHELGAGGGGGAAYLCACMRVLIYKMMCVDCWAATATKHGFFCWNSVHCQGQGGGKLWQLWTVTLTL